MDETLEQQFERRIAERMKALQPQVDEYRELEALLARVNGEAEPSRDSTRHGARRRPLEERKAQILGILAAEPELPLARIAERLGLSGPRVVQVVKQLKADGALFQADRGLVVAEGMASKGKHKEET